MLLLLLLLLLLLSNIKIFCMFYEFKNLSDESIGK